MQHQLMLHAEFQSVETGPGGLSHGFQEPPVCGRVPRSQGHEISGGLPPMKMAQSGASASLINKTKIYVFGGCWDVANSSNWLEGVMCRGKIVWRWPDAISWKVVRGLEELQHQHIIKICSFSDKTIAIFWEAPQQQGLLELWYAEISMERYKVNEGWWEVWGNIESSAAVLSHSSSHTSSFNLLYVATVFA
ncbi:hypothetical protein DY000_02045091 [Brassica cretica]|uniref:F-box associated domain-containing protein n=1 Tax=Brassica cretica TaxID=69181 RepID=A0ABQ7ETS1_BRACR|nr:hypothetical protein DY000_02045091 [Brassica cretica]